MIDPEIKKNGLEAAVNWVIEHQAKGETLLKQFGVQQIIQAYIEGAKQPREWHEDVWVLRSIGSTSDVDLLYKKPRPFYDHFFSSLWKERRFYREVGGKTEFIRAEAIGE